MIEDDSQQNKLTEYDMNQSPLPQNVHPTTIPHGKVTIKCIKGNNLSKFVSF